MTTMELPAPRLELRNAISASGRPAWQIAHLAGISPTVLSHITTGRREVRADEAVRIADVLEIDVDGLFPNDGVSR